MAETKKEKKKLGLSTKILISLLAGAITGVLIHYVMPDSSFKSDILINGILYVLGNGFIRLMQMLVVPLVFCSLVCGSMAIGDTKTLGKVGIKTIIFYLCTTALAVCVALGVAFLISPGMGMNQVASETQEAATQTVNFAETLLNMIPKNIFTSLAEGDMLPVIIFALFVGIMLAKLGNKASTVSNFFSEFNEVMMEMTMAVMSVAPVGVFCLIAKTFSETGFDAFLPMLQRICLRVILALAVQCFGIYQILLFLFTRLNPARFIKKFFPVMMFAFSTSTSNTTIPLSIDTLHKKVGVSKQVASFTIPLGATINMDGTSMHGQVAVVVIYSPGIWH